MLLYAERLTWKGFNARVGFGWFETNHISQGEKNVRLETVSMPVWALGGLRHRAIVVSRIGPLEEFQCPCGLWVV